MKKPAELRMQFRVVWWSILGLCLIARFYVNMFMSDYACSKWTTPMPLQSLALNPLWKCSPSTIRCAYRGRNSSECLTFIRFKPQPGTHCPMYAAFAGSLLLYGAFLRRVLWLPIELQCPEDDLLRQVTLNRRNYLRRNHTMVENSRVHNSW